MTRSVYERRLEQSPSSRRPFAPVPLILVAHRWSPGIPLFQRFNLNDDEHFSHFTYLARSDSPGAFPLGDGATCSRHTSNPDDQYSPSNPSPLQPRVPRPQASSLTGQFFKRYVQGAEETSSSFNHSWLLGSNDERQSRPSTVQDFSLSYLLYASAARGHESPG